MARFAVWAAIIALVLDYLRRHNVTFAKLLPLPISIRATETIFPKASAVLVERCADPAGFVRKFAEHALSKGETFFFAGPSDPFTDTALPRIAIGRNFWRLDRLTFDARPGGLDRRFVLEAVWYGRACACATGQQSIDTLLDGIEALMHGGVTTPRSAPQTVNLIWCSDAPPSDRLQRILTRARAANVRVVLITSNEASPELKPLFGEIHPDAAAISFAAPRLELVLAACDRAVTRVVRLVPIRH